MNEQLIKFIELCLMDGVVTDKEREVIFRKSKELGVPEDECEIILEGMIQQKGGVSEVQNIPKKVISTEKKELELTFNNLNQTKVLKNDIKDLELELKKKEPLINKQNKEIRKIIKELNGKVNPIKKSIFLKTPFYDNEDFEGGQIYNYLISLLSIDKSYLNKISPSSEGILLVVTLWLDVRYFLIFKKENNEVIRFMIERKNEFSYKYGSTMRVLYENHEKNPFDLLTENIDLIDEQFLKNILSENVILNLTKDKIVGKTQKTREIKGKDGWRGKIINEDILDMELELLNNLSHKVYLN